MNQIVEAGDRQVQMMSTSRPSMLLRMIGAGSVRRPLPPAFANDRNNIVARRLWEQAEIRERAMIFGPISGGVMAGIAMIPIHPIMLLGMPCIGMLASTIMINLMIAVPRLSNQHSPGLRTFIVPGDMNPECIRRMARGLGKAVRDGLHPDDRHVLQCDMADASSLIEALLGAKPHDAVDECEPIPIPNTLSKCANLLEETAERLVGSLDQENGAQLTLTKSLVAIMAGPVETICRHFDLDPCSFAGGDEEVPAWPGNETSTAIRHTSSELAINPSSLEVRELARRWITGPQVGDPSIVTSANAAAREDFDDLETRWRAARENAVDEDLEQIDQDHAAGCAALARRLGSAISHRSSVLRDELSTGRRYLEAKHPQDVI